MASVLLKELEYKVEKLKYKKLVVMQPRQDQKQIWTSKGPSTRSPIWSFTVVVD